MKICGLTSEADVDAAVEAGADLIGFVLAPSPRRVSPGQAATLAARAVDRCETVVVLRNPSDGQFREAVALPGIDRIQAEANAHTVAAVREGVLAASRLLPVLHDTPDLLDQLEFLRDSGPPHIADVIHLEGEGRGGRGVRPDWDRAARLASTCRLTLAGGLSPDNVGQAIRLVMPAAVDVSSGVETEPGRKDHGLIREFVLAVRQAERDLKERT